MKYISYGHKRIYIDIAKSGCGSGCAYCYVDSAASEQKLISYTEADRIVDELKSYGTEGNIISFCSNTEPFKSEAAVELVIYIVKQIINAGAVIQFSTKEVIGEKYIKILNDLCASEGQIFINISIPFLDNNETIEPGAAPVERRLENFNALSRYEKLKACLYIKPFSKDTTRNLNEYIRLINGYKIRYVCVGMEFFKNNIIEACRSYYDEGVFTRTAQKNNKEAMLLFADTISKETGAEVVFSSACLFRQKNICSVRLYSQDAEFCKDCFMRGR